MTDLSKLVPEKDTIEIILRHPNTGEPLMNEGEDATEMSVTLYAPHTKEYRKAGFTQASTRLKDRKGKDLTFEDMEEGGVELLVDVTVDWDITYENKKPKFTKEKAREVYSKVFWLRGQLEEAINNSVVFTEN